MAKRTETRLTHPRAPFATFLDQQSFDENLPDAISEHQLIADFRKDGDEASLWIGLTALQWDYAAIETVIADHNYKPRTVYGLAPSF